MSTKNATTRSKLSNGKSGSGARNSIQQPSARSSRRTNRGADITSSRKSKTVCHRERIGDVNFAGASAFKRFFINPGVLETFSWLRDESTDWEQYRFSKLSFEYVPTCQRAVLEQLPWP